MRQLCPQIPSSDVLNPCRWADRPPEVTIFPGQVVRGVVVTVEQGYRFAIRIEDPGGHLDKHLGKTPGAGLQVLVSYNGQRSFAAHSINRDQRGDDRVVTIPFDKDVDIRVSSGFFQLAEANGAAIAGREKAYRVRVARSSVNNGLLVRVTGTKN